MKYEIISDAPVLIPNSEHRNFTQTTEVIECGAQVNGQPKQIQGLRRGEPFTYKLFITDNNKLIHLNKTKKMNTTEVTLGADGQGNTTPTLINIPPTGNTFGIKKVGGAIVGAGIGFWYSKHHKHSHTKTSVFVIAGAILGYVAGTVWENQATVKVKPSK